jgi:hypothetical protein
MDYSYMFRLTKSNSYTLINFVYDYQGDNLNIYEELFTPRKELHYSKLTGRIIIIYPAGNLSNDITLAIILR